MHVCLLWASWFTYVWNLDAFLLGEDMADWDFLLHACAFDTKHTIEDPCVAYIPSLPNDMLVEHIILLLLLVCDRCLGLSPMMSTLCAIFVVFTVSGMVYLINT